MLWDVLAYLAGDKVPYLRSDDKAAFISSSVTLCGDQDPSSKNLAPQIQKAERYVDTITIDCSIEEPDECSKLLVKWLDAGEALLHGIVGRSRYRCTRLGELSQEA